jgi:hypothetical protein
MSQLRGLDRWDHGGEMWRTSELPQMLSECRRLDAERKAKIGASLNRNPPAPPAAGPEQTDAKKDEEDFLF